MLNKTLFIALICPFFAVAQTENVYIQNDTEAIAANILNQYEAEKIMGEAVRLAENTFTKQGDTLVYKCAYSARTSDAAKEMPAYLGMMIQEFATEALATQAFADIKQSNTDPTMVETVFNLGSEAYFYTDNPQRNFYFILVRKQHKLFRMKLNVVTSKASLEAFKMFAIVATNLM